MTRDDGADYLLVGRVVKPHGLKGEIKILPFSGDPANFVNYSGLLLVDPESDQEELHRVERSRIQGRQAIVALDEINDRNGSEMLVGFEVWARVDELPALGEDEFYWQDLIGMSVASENGRELGEISSLLAGGGHDILVITGRGREYMIPAVAEFIVEIDSEQGKVVVDPPPGLLEINN